MNTDFYATQWQSGHNPMHPVGIHTAGVLSSVLVCAYTTYVYGDFVMIQILSLYKSIFLFILLHFFSTVCREQLTKQTLNLQVRACNEGSSYLPTNSVIQDNYIILIGHTHLYYDGSNKTVWKRFNGSQILFYDVLVSHKAERRMPSLQRVQLSLNFLTTKT